MWCVCIWYWLCWLLFSHTCCHGTYLKSISSDCLFYFAISNQHEEPMIYFFIQDNFTIQTCDFLKLLRMSTFSFFSMNWHCCYWNCIFQVISKLTKDPLDTYDVWSKCDFICHFFFCCAKRYWFYAYLWHTHTHLWQETPDFLPLTTIGIFPVKANIKRRARRMPYGTRLSSWGWIFSFACHKGSCKKMK